MNMNTVYQICTNTNKHVLRREFGYQSESKDGQLVKYMFTNMRGGDCEPPTSRHDTINFIISPEKWKKVRSMLSGVFTSGKLKTMTHHIVRAADQMQERLSQLEEEGKEFEIRDLTSTFAMDAFASSGFGIEQDSFKDPDNIFRRMALEMVGAPGYTTGSDQARVMFIMTFPSNNLVLCI